MCEILRATGCTQRELEPVLARPFTPLQVGQFGNPNVSTVPGAAAREKTRDSPFPQVFEVLYCLLWGRESSSPFSFLRDSSSPVALPQLAADVSSIAVDLVFPARVTLVPDCRKGFGDCETAVRLCFSFCFKE